MDTNGGGSGSHTEAEARGARRRNHEGSKTRRGAGGSMMTGSPSQSASICVICGPLLPFVYFVPFVVKKSPMKWNHETHQPHEMGKSRVSHGGTGSTEEATTDKHL